MIDLVLSTGNGYECKTDPGEPGRNLPRMSINDQEARILGELVKGRIVLEIGTGLGVSTRAMAEMALCVFTMDIDPWVRENVWKDLPGNVHPIRNAIDLPLNFGAAFIDGLHTYDACTADIRLCCNHLIPGGLLIFHDIYMQQIWDAVVDSGLPWVHIQTTAGMAMAWNDDPQEAAA